MAFRRIAGPATTALTRPRQIPLLRRPSRLYATASNSKPPNPTSQFYRTFTRPIAKVLVLAVFTYQSVYWGWLKLEADEHQQKTDVEIADLEARVGALDKARQTTAEETKEEKPKKKSWW